ncbi:MAG TPA: L,D-transpeptidase, partial [Arthrobacter sp.]
LMPYSDMFSVIHAPLMDSSAHFTGEVATLADTRTESAAFYDRPEGELLGALPAAQVVPVVGRMNAATPAWAAAAGWKAPTGEWIRVMLPSRVALPSSAPESLRPRINEGTAWIWAGDMKISDQKARITVDKAARTVTVTAVDGSANSNGDVAVIFPAIVGDNVPTGPTFMAQHSAADSGCSGGPFLPLSAQGTNADHLDGQRVNPIAFMGPGDDCFEVGPRDLTPVLPNVIRLSPADSTELARYAVPGTPVDVIAGSKTS